MRYGNVLEEIEPKHRIWNPATLAYEYVGNSPDPTVGFKLSDVDDSSNPQYQGYVDCKGNWYIVEINTVAKTYRYYAGTEDYPTNWTARGELEYGYFYDIF